MGKKYTAEEIREACSDLHEAIVEAHVGARPGYALGRPVQVHAIVRSVAKSGMSRRMDFYILRNEHACRITRQLAVLLDMSSDPDKGMRIDGGGMDMGFHVVYSARAAYARHTGDQLNLEAQVQYL